MSELKCELWSLFQIDTGSKVLCDEIIIMVLTVCKPETADSFGLSEDSNFPLCSDYSPITLLWTFSDKWKSWKSRDKPNLMYIAPKNRKIQYFTRLT